MEKNYSSQTNEVEMIPYDLLDGKEYMLGNVVANVPEVYKGVFQSTENGVNTKRSVDSSMSSINALIDSCVKYSEAHTPTSVGDDSGMNLLASVATGEITRSGASSPEGSPPRTTTMVGNASVNNEGPTLCNDGEPFKPSISNEDPQQNGEPFSKNNGELDECSGGTSFSATTASIAGKSDTGGGEQIQAKAVVIKDESHDSVSCKKHIANNYSPSQDETKDGVQCKEVLNKDQEDSLMHPPSNRDEKGTPDQGQNNNASIDHISTLATHHGSANNDEGQVVDSSSVCEEPDVEHSAKQMWNTLATHHGSAG